MSTNLVLQIALAVLTLLPKYQCELEENPWRNNSRNYFSFFLFSSSSFSDHDRVGQFSKALLIFSAHFHVLKVVHCCIN